MVYSYVGNNLRKLRISKLILKKEELKNLGLSEFQTTRLNNTLALVGKNGSGKTRYLKAIENRLRNIDIVDLLEENFKFLPSQVENIVTPQKKNLNNFRNYRVYKKS